MRTRRVSQSAPRLCDLMSMKAATSGKSDLPIAGMAAGDASARPAPQLACDLPTFRRQNSAGIE